MGKRGCLARDHLRGSHSVFGVGPDEPRIGNAINLISHAQLGNAGMTAESIATTATVNLEKTDAGFTITAVHLDVKAKIPGADKTAFDTAANNAKAGCPVSRVLNATITMDAALEA